MSKFAFDFFLDIRACLVYERYARRDELMQGLGRSWREPGWRRRAAQLLREEGFLRGAVSVRRRVCGKPRCRCVEGERHEAMYVVYQDAGRTVQLYVPKEWEERVRRWVKSYREVAGILKKLSGEFERHVRQRRG